MLRTFFLVMLFPIALHAQATAGAPWVLALSGVETLGNGECRAVLLSATDSTGRDTPRRPDGQRVSIADFDMAATPSNAAVGKYSGPQNWSVCACQTAAAGTAVTVTATYPSAKLAQQLKIYGVQASTSLPITISGPVSNTYNAPGCPKATSTSASLASAGAVAQPAHSVTTSAPVSSAASAAASTTPNTGAMVGPTEGVLFVTLTGARQGQLVAESAKGIAVRSLAYQITVPQTNGATTGRRQYSPVTITKEWDGASPQLQQALVNGEALTVQIDRLDMNGTATEKIILRNALVVGIKHASDGRRETEEISFGVSQIEFRNVAGNTAAQDNLVLSH